MTAEEQIGKYGISAVAVNGQVVLEMHAELLTMKPDEWRRWLFHATAAMYQAQRHEEMAA